MRKVSEVLLHTRHDDLLHQCENQQHVVLEHLVAVGAEQQCLAIARPQGCVQF